MILSIVLMFIIAGCDDEDDKFNVMAFAPSEVINDEWSLSESSWGHSEKQELFYNADKTLDHELELSWSEVEGGYFYTGRTEYFYNSDGSLDRKDIYEDVAVLNGTGGDLEERTDCFYYPNGLLETLIFSEDDGSGLDETEREIYVYNDDDSIDNVEIHYNGATVSDGDERYMYKYLADGRVDTETTQEYDSTNGWEDISQRMFIYYPNGKPMIAMTYSLQFPMLAQWTEYFYTTSGKLERLTISMLIPDLTEVMAIEFDHNSNGQTVTWVMKSYDGDSKSLVNESRTTFTWGSKAGAGFAKNLPSDGGALIGAFMSESELSPVNDVFLFAYN